MDPRLNPSFAPGVLPSLRNAIPPSDGSDKKPELLQVDRASQIAFAVLTKKIEQMQEDARIQNQQVQDMRLALSSHCTVVQSLVSQAATSAGHTAQMDQIQSQAQQEALRSLEERTRQLEAGVNGLSQITQQVVVLVAKQLGLTIEGLTVPGATDVKKEG